MTASSARASQEKEKKKVCQLKCRRLIATFVSHGLDGSLQ